MNSIARLSPVWGPFLELWASARPERNVDEGFGVARASNDASVQARPVDLPEPPLAA